MTSKLTFVFVLLFLSFSTLQAQSYTLNSQAEVNAFPTDCNCTSIIGDLTISGADITDLTPLNTLFFIGGDVLIEYNDNLHSLYGLNNLIFIEGLLWVVGNEKLIDLQGLNNLQQIEGHVVIASNNSLLNLQGLNSLNSIGGGLSIPVNPVLISLDGLNNLTSIGTNLLILSNSNLISISALSNISYIPGFVDINRNSKLTSLNGLNNLTRIEGTLLIDTNMQLSSLEGLNSLSSVGGLLIIADNHSLPNLDGLDNLQSVEDPFYIFRNISLSSIEALSNLNHLGTDLNLLFNESLTSLEGLNNIDYLGNSIEIKENLNLTDCCAIQDLLNNNEVGGIIDISNNATGCDSQTEIEDYCNGLPSPWETASVGNVEGTSEYDSEEESFTLSANDNSGFTSDNLQFVYQEICDNAEIYAHISDVDNQGFAGIMMRETLDGGSKKVALKTQLSSFVQREIRSSTNGYATSQHIYRPSASWLKLVRNGNSFIGYTSTNGINWQFAMVANVPMDGCIYVGITAENFNSTSTATFDNVHVTGNQGNGLVIPENSSIANNSRGPSELIIAPNPASHQTTIEFTNTHKGILNLKILNSLGQQVYAKQYSDREFIREEIQLSEFTPGLYFVNIEQENGKRLVRKLIVN